MPANAPSDLPADLQAALARHAATDQPRLDRLWSYYRNPIELVATSAGTPSPVGAWYRQAQEAGLPTRIKGRTHSAVPGSEANRREVVIENDIAWRLHSMVDFMLARPVRFESLADDTETRERVEPLLEQVWERSGGIALIQDAALLAHVFGHVDLLLRIDETHLHTADPARAFTIEPVDPRRGVPLVSPDDYRRLNAYALRAEREVHTSRRNQPARPARETITEVLTPGRRRVYRDDTAIATEQTRLLADVIPIVHIQNISQPFAYAGLGEVEPLIPLQDKLNTRLSDRANRVTLQSFRMYLAKGLESFDASAIAPGTVWTTNNPDASIQPFGGDLYNPGEESHIAEIREAIDKLSAVPPLAGGVVRAKLGNLSSANALRVTLLGLIAKTQRKRITYARGLESMSALVLRALHDAGVMHLPEPARATRVVWPAMPFEEENNQLLAARAKQDLGIDRDTVLAELGYPDKDPGIV
jgi:hypothetical protein